MLMPQILFFPQFYGSLLQVVHGSSPKHGVNQPRTRANHTAKSPYLRPLYPRNLCQT
ncbi:hypothetical protein BGX38DRAFT_1188488 [Terfezia claveryi]|nr:hypothetical protein BGX38DRAFT_1188488 [Terfezia claveryi]